MAATPAVGGLLLLAACVHAAPSARFSSAPQMVYSWTRDHCPSYPAMPPPSCVPDIKPTCDPDVVDACPRVWASAGGGGYRMLGSVNGVSRAQVGPSLDALAHSCGAPYANASYDPVASHFRGDEWLEAPYVVNASHVVVLTHVDSKDSAGEYLYTSTTLYASSDGGASFAPARPPPAHLVATSPYDNTGLATGVRGVGFGMPSSILRDPRSGLYHVLLLSSWGEAVHAQRGGLCLLRTHDVTDPASWRAWNGSSFSVALNVSPLLGPVPNPDAHTCAPLLDTAGAPLAMRHLSLLWSSYFDAYLIFGEAAGAGALGSPGWAFSTSQDLVTWAVPTPVDVAGAFAASGNASIARADPMPGRFIKAPGSHTYYEGGGGAWKVALGSCEPCPALDACGTAEAVSPSELAALPNATFGFSCSLIFDTRGYIDYVYSVLADDSAHRATGADASLNTVGQDAHIFLVAKKCAGALWDHKSPLPTCTPLDAFGRDQRDVVRATIHFDGAHNVAPGDLHNPSPQTLPAATVRGAPQKWGGVNFVAEGFEGPFSYDAPASIASLSTAAALGVNTVAFSFPWYTASINSTALAYRVDGPCPSGVPFNNASSPRDAAVITAVRAARGLGMRTILRPMIDPQWDLPVNRGASRGEIGAHFGSAEWAAWFVSYRTFLLHWAAIAAAEHVEVLCVGAELSATEGQDAAWRATIAAVRAVYSGIVYYSATGGDLSWWNESDWIAQDMYPALTNASTDPALVSVDALVDAWGVYLERFRAMGAKHNRSVLLQETGICSIEKVGLYNAPWFYSCYGEVVNEDVQAKYYESVFRAPYAQDWVTGALFWKWAAQGGPTDTTFFPLNKSAARVMEKFLGQR